MAQAILLPLLQEGEFSPEHVFAVVGQQSSAKKIRDKFPSSLQVVASDDEIAKEVWTSPIQLLAVKPQQLEAVASKASLKLESAQASPILISLLAGVPIIRLQKLFPEHNCVRAAPNTPALIGEGLTGLSWGKGVTEEQRLCVQKIFLPISEVFELPEHQLDGFLALTSSGPAYVSLMAEALADGAVASGLPRELANFLVHRTLGGTASLLKEKGLHPGELKDMVASPGGTTIAALRHIEKAGVRSALIEAVVAAAERSRELA